MDNEKTLDLKEGETTPTDTGQSEETNPEDTDDVDDSTDDSKDDSTDDGSDDKVVLSKEQHAKLLKERDNYKKGLLSSKKKKTEKTEEDVLTKKDFQKINEKKAISSFLENNPEVDKNWSEFVSFYRDARGRDDVDSIVKDLDDAKTLYVKHNPPKEPDEDKETRSDLSSDKSLSNAGSGKDQVKESGGLLKKSKPINEWYKSE